MTDTQTLVVAETQVPVEKTPPRLYIIHHDDHDGHVGAAIAVSVNKHAYLSIHCLATNYGKPIPFDVEALKAEDSVYIIDFSYKKEILEDINKRVKFLVVLDHHESMREEISGLPYVVFDTTRSGAKLAWDYFTDGYFGDNPVVDIVDAYDLWNKNFQMEHRGSVLKWREVVAYHIGTYEHQKDIEYWKNQLAKFDIDAAALNQGAAAYSDILAVAENAKHSALSRRVLGGTTFRGMIFNGKRESVSLVSDALIYNIDTQEINFEITFCYFSVDDEPGKMIVSIRSAVGRESLVTAMAVAVKLGGGGHKHASGVKLDYTGEPEDFPAFLVNLLKENYDSDLQEVLL